MINHDYTMHDVSNCKW